MHQAERHHREREDHGEPPRVDVAAVLVAVAGERDDEAELRDLRRLELEPPGSWNHACVPLTFEPTGVSTRNSSDDGDARTRSSEKSRSLR